MPSGDSERRVAPFSAALTLFVLLLTSSVCVRADPEPISGKLAAANPDAGKKVFLVCSACHVAAHGAKPTIGPNLWNLLGRKVASETGFDYSDSLKGADGEWDYEKLNLYLFDPKLIAPEGRMPFPGLKSDSERVDLIAYLRTLSDKPIALPKGDGTSTVAASEDGADKWQGLQPGPGREDVFYRCSACHSLMIVKQQGLSRSRWDELLEWMVEEQGMAPIDDEATRGRVLDYLSTHFGEN